MNKKITQKLISYTQIAANLAVLVALLITVSEIREANRTLKASTHQELTGLINDWRMKMSDPVLTKLNLEVFSGGFYDLTKVEQQRIAEMYLSLWNLYEAAYVSYESGTLDRKEWDRFKKGVCRNRKKHTIVWNHIKDTLINRFADYVNRQCPT